MSFSILVVDDSDVMRSIIRRVLGLSGIDVGEVFEAGNGAEALEIMDRNWVDVVLTDINMPVMNGMDLISHMRESETHAATPVIVISTEGRDDHIEKIMNAGASGYITKPFRPEDVAKTICTALGTNPDERFIKEPEDSDF